MADSPRWPVSAAVAIVVGGALLFAPSVGADFVWDDRPLIVYDMRLRTFAGVIESITGDFFNWASDAGGYGYWRPTVTLSYALQRAFFGPSSVAFHLFNVLTHALIMLATLTVDTPNSTTDAVIQSKISARAGGLFAFLRVL